MSASKGKPGISAEKSKAILTQVLAKEENKTCADCLSKGPRWASWNIGVMLCIRCSGIHRSLGVHISRVKSVNLDTWNYEQLVSVCSKGNGWAKEKYEANLPSNHKRPQTDSEMEHFIRDKYERLKYCYDGEIPLRSLTEFDFVVKRNSRSKKGSAENISLSSNSREPNAIARPKAIHTAVKTEPTQILTTTNGDFTQQQQKSNMDDLLGLNTPSFTAPPDQPSSQSQDFRPSSDLTNDLFSSLQPGVNNTSTQQQSNTPAQPSPMSKDTIMSLYGRNTGMMQTNPYAMAGSYNAPAAQPSMMGYPQRPMPPNMGYVGYNQQGMQGYPQQANMQAMQQQYQWQQQQMQMQMQNMQLGAGHQMPAAGGMRSFGSFPQTGSQQPVYGGAQTPQANFLSLSNQSGLSSSHPSLMNQNMNSWGAASGQQMNNGQTLSSNLWK